MSVLKRCNCCDFIHGPQLGSPSDGPSMCSGHCIVQFCNSLASHLRRGILSSCPCPAMRNAYLVPPTALMLGSLYSGSSTVVLFDITGPPTSVLLTYLRNLTFIYHVIVWGLLPVGSLYYGGGGARCSSSDPTLPPPGGGRGSSNVSSHPPVPSQKAGVLPLEIIKVISIYSVSYSCLIERRTLDSRSGVAIFLGKNNLLKSKFGSFAYKSSATRVSAALTRNLEVNA